jgi:CO/xanthine dehydrogenase Mo-binding subunit
MSSTRRQFIKRTGALVVYFSLPGSVFAQYTSPNPGETQKVLGNASLDTWIRVEAGGLMVISAGKVEFGQGIRTALAQIAAEELDISLSRVRMTEVDTAHSPDESYTFSAMSVQQSGTRVRKAAAYARHLLLARAAEVLQILESELSVSDGSILHNGKLTDVDYWKVLEGRNFDTVVPDDVVGKPASQYQLVGYPAQRLDIPDKVFANASYLADMRMPDMVYARVVRAHKPRTGLVSVDSNKVGRIPGVLKIVRNGSFLAVVAERESQAAAAATELGNSCKWQSGGPLPDAGKLSAWLKSARAETHAVAERLTDSEETAAKVLSAEYSRPFLAHASIAPSAAIALWDGKNLVVWSHGQGMYPLRGAIARALDLDEQQVRCIHVESGGVYGHNGADDAACDAAAIAIHLPNRPVKLQWSRVDEFTAEPYGSAMTVSTQAGLNSQGRIVEWKQNIWSCTHSTRPGGAAGAGNFLYAQQKQNPLPAPHPRTIPQPIGGADRNAVPLYDIPAVKIDKHIVQEMPIRVSALRSLGAYTNIFSIESFMDELASVNQADPFEFRLAHLSDQRARIVLERLRDLSGWTQRPESGNGTGWGIGFAKYKNLSAYFAVFVALTFNQEDARIQLDKIYGVIDAGLVVNPDGVRAQIEGGILQSASWTLKEQVQFDQSGILSKDWISYPILSFSEIPEVTIDIIERPDQPWLGVAEAAQGPTAAAIANAIFHASGKRLRDIPLTAAKILSAGYGRLPDSETRKKMPLPGQ